jgi:hypothetical protein
MSNSDVSLAVFDALLGEAGFTKTEEPDAVVRYEHRPSDTVVMVRMRDMQAPVPWGTLASTRKVLDGRGVLSAADFDRRVCELEQKGLGKQAATTNGAPGQTSGRRSGNGRRRSAQSQTK